MVGFNWKLHFCIVMLPARKFVYKELPYDGLYIEICAYGYLVLPMLSFRQLLSWWCF